MACKATNVEQVFGDSLENRFVTIDEVLKDEPFIFSVWPFYFSKFKQEKLKKQGIHDLVNHAGPIMLDSGGFQLIKRKMKINPDRTLKIYENANLRKFDLAIALDYCPKPSEKPITRMNKIKRSNEIFRYMKNKNDKILHVVHGWTWRELEKSLEPVNDMFSFGSYFAMMTIPLNLTMIAKNLSSKVNLKEHIMDRFIMFTRLIKNKHLDGLKIHVLGASSSNSAHLMWYAGMDQTDSAAWRIKAAFGKIALPGISEIPISRGKWNNKHDKELRSCECPVCNGLSLNERIEVLSSDFKNRALHNAHVYLEEREIAREIIGSKKHLPYLKNRFKKSHFWKKFLNWKRYS